MIVHSKMKMLSSFTHPQVFTCMSSFLLLSTKEDILKNVGHQTVDGALTLILSENIMEVNGYHQLF